MTVHRTHDAVRGEVDSLTLDVAREHIEATALSPSRGGQVGLELEFHLVDLAEPRRRPSWDEVLVLAAGLPTMPAGSRVTVEPGGQLELSTPPGNGAVEAIGKLQSDRDVFRQALAEAGYGAAPLGTDPARAVRRINPQQRYVAMERHFTALGCAGPGRAMMSATAALQVNLDAGPADRWPERLRRIHRLGPVLVAASACSPLLAGHASGWHSMRQQVWAGIDNARTRPLDGRDPRSAWASYALNAPLMLVRDEVSGHIEPVLERVPFAQWVQGRGGPARLPSRADIDYHLTTLFPPVRPRGYIEIRCLDALPDRWWPALAGLTVTLVDDPIAADHAAELCERLRGERLRGERLRGERLRGDLPHDAWTRAARDGLRDPELRAVATGCLAIAAERCAPELRSGVEAYAELVASGRTPGDELRERVDAGDPLSVLEEEAHA